MDKIRTGQAIEVTVEYDESNPIHEYLVDRSDKLLRIELATPDGGKPIQSFAEAKILQWSQPVPGLTYLTVLLTLVELEAPPIPEWRDMETESMKVAEKEVIEDIRGNPKLLQEIKEDPSLRELWSVLDNQHPREDQAEDAGEK